jgi:MraZ protein
VFIGTEFKTLDRKGRLVVPSRYRKIAGPEEEGAGFYIIAGPGPYAVLYTKQEWIRLYEKVSRSSAPEGDLFDLRRKVFSSADFLALDKQGRVILPPTLIAHVGLKQEIAVLGAGDHFEIWNKDTWEAYRLGTSPKVELNAQDQALWRTFLG